MNWDEKIESLVKLAKAARRYINSQDEQGTDYNEETIYNLREAYEEFCQWRHDEPYVVDEIRELLERKEYTDKLTGITLTVEKEHPEYPGHPKLTMDFKGSSLPLEAINAAMERLQNRARISPEYRMRPVYSVLPEEKL